MGSLTIPMEFLRPTGGRMIVCGRLIGATRITAGRDQYDSNVCNDELLVHGFSLSGDPVGHQLT